MHGAPASPRRRYTFGAFEVDAANRRLLRDGAPVAVTARVFDILLVLVQRSGQPISKEELIAQVWGEVVVEEGNLARNVSTLRKVLGEAPDDHQFIVTLAGRGYQFVAPVRVHEDATSATIDTDASAVAEPASARDASLDVAVPDRRRPALDVFIGALVVLALAIGVAIGWLLGRGTAARDPGVTTATSQGTARFVLPLADASGLYTFASASVAIAPDGSRIAYVADEGGRPVLFVQELDAERPRRIDGSEGARSPFFSPDGQWIAFGAGGRLKKIWLRGGATQIICDAPMFYGGTWGRDGTIVFLPWFARGLWKVSANGGTPVLLAAPRGDSGERGYCWPQILADGDTLLFTIWTGGSFDEAQVALLSMKTGERRIVHKGGTYARVAEPGTLLVARAGVLHALPFDPSARRVTGAPRPVLDAVLVDLNSGAGFYDVARNGTLVFARGGPQVPARQLVWVDRSGKRQPATAKGDAYSSPRLAPDGHRLAVWLQHSLVDVWLLDPTRDAINRLSHGGDDHSPVWSPDGVEVAYDSSRDGRYNLYRRRADGSTDEQRVTRAHADQFVNDWSSDGRWLIATELADQRAADLVLIDPRGTEAPRSILRSPYAETEASVSPDGRLVAFVSDESGQPEIYVRAIDGSATGVQVSTGGGEEPAWSATGREIVYRAGARMMSATLTTTTLTAAASTNQALRTSRPITLFEGRYHYNLYPTRTYDVARDGRFLMVDEPVSPHRALTVVLGWTPGIAANVTSSER
jgi:eukaryotic-like serine/threonine-protein kinase